MRVAESLEREKLFHKTVSINVPYFNKYKHYGWTAEKSGGIFPMCALFLLVVFIIITAGETFGN